MSLLAELKKSEEMILDYIPVTEVPKKVHTENLDLPNKPPKKKTFLLEKVLIASMVIGCVLFAFAMTYMRIEIANVEQHTMDLQQTVEQYEKDITQLQQEKSELSSAERIKAVAKKAGLTFKEENIRNVK